MLSLDFDISSKANNLDYLILENDHPEFVFSELRKKTIPYIQKHQCTILDQYSGQNLGCLFGDDAIVTKGFIIRAGFFQTLPIG